MKRKAYKLPQIYIEKLATCSLICASVNGVYGTGSLTTTVNTQSESNTYLSRTSSIWDDE